MKANGNENFKDERTLDSAKKLGKQTADAAQRATNPEQKKKLAAMEKVLETEAVGPARRIKISLFV